MPSQENIVHMTPVEAPPPLQIGIFLIVQGMMTKTRPHFLMFGIFMKCMKVTMNYLKIRNIHQEDSINEGSVQNPKVFSLLQ